MKTSIKILLVTMLLSISGMGYAQINRALQYDRLPGKAGINVFETSKTDTVEYQKMKVRVGGDFAIIFQGLSQDNSLVGDTLVDLSSNFSLPTANLNIDVQIADGVRMHLRTYLSSRHHPEAWVKGGYFQMDKLDFIKPGFLSGIMEYTTFRFGMDEINYGDTHFRRSDNARSMYNPFVGNFIMDSFTTEPFGEITVQKSGWIGVLGISNGRLNQSPIAGDDGLVIFGKAGFDKQLNDDLRLRLTGSFYSSGDKSTRDYLYNGDRAGARYYNVLDGINSGGSDFMPRFNSGFAYQNAFQVNPFVKFQGLEFFGVYESVKNGADGGGDYSQLGAELLYRFGSDEQLYIGGRYNKVDGKASDTAGDIEIARTNLGFGWFLTDYVMAKLEYVNSSYDGSAYAGTKFQGAEFNGVVIEAVISF